MYSLLLSHLLPVQIWSRKWQPIPVFLPGKFHGQKSLAGYSPWGCKESDAIEHARSAHLYRLQVFLPEMPFLGFLGSSAGRESPCNTGDPGSIPGSGSSPEEGIGYSLQYSWASLMAQKVKNPPAMEDNRVWSLAWEDPLEKGMATHSIILARRIPWPEETGGLQSMGSQRVRHNWATNLFTLS